MRVTYVSKAMLLGALFLAPAWAATATSAPPNFASCSQISDDKERLACYDHQATLQKSAPATMAPAPVTPAPTSGAAAAAPVPPPTQLTPEQRIGLAPGKVLKMEGQGTTELKELTAKIEGVSTITSGREQFVLDNGQVWRQVEPDSKFSVQPGDSVRITRGALGSFFMSAGSHMNTRVSRAH